MSKDEPRVVRFTTLPPLKKTFCPRNALKLLNILLNILSEKESIIHNQLLAISFDK